MNPNEEPTEPTVANKPLSTNSNAKTQVAGGTSAAPVSGRMVLFQYVTMLASGLALLTLLTFAGYTLLDHFLGEKANADVFAEFTYYSCLWLVVSLVVFGGLHVWMRLRTRNVAEKDQPASLKVFLAIFLTILALTVVGALGAIIFVGVDMMLGTGNYSTKSAWLIILGALQVMAWAGLLWGYFKRPKAATVYAITAGVVVVVVVALLTVFPLLGRRDAVIDARTSSDLTTIVAAVGTYTQSNNKLPGTLKDIKLDDTVASRVGMYEFQPSQTPAQDTKSTPELDDFSSFFDSSYSTGSGSTFTYKLCATFKTDTNKEDEDKSAFSLFGGSSGMSKHPAGRHCFDQTAYGKSDSPSTGPAEPALDAFLNSSNSF